MNNDQLQAFQEYEELKAKAKEIDTRLEELKPFILPLVPEDKELQGKDGYFYIQKKAKWKYSSDIVSREKDLKKDKEREEANGTAEPTYTPILYYRSGTPPVKE